VQAAIDKEAAIADAIAAIDGLPAPGALTLDHEGAVEAARDLVSTAIDDHGAEAGDITNLQDLVDVEGAITALKGATTAVEAAEDSKEQADVDTARGLVADLPEGGAKSDLKDRLDAVQAAIDKEAAIADAIAAIDGLPAPGALTLDHEGAVEAARDLVNTAIDDHGAEADDINNLQDLVDAEGAITALKEATTAVEAAEDSKEQADVDTARGLVADLPEGGARDALDARLDDLQEVIDAKVTKEEAVQAAIAAISALPAPDRLTLDDGDDVAEARGKVDAALALGAVLGDISNLGDLETLEALLEALQEAIAAVEAAEDSRDRDDVNDAFGLVIDLPDSIVKADLLHRLEVVLTEIEKQAAIDEVIAAIEALPAPGELTLADREAVTDVRYLVKRAKSVHGVTDDEITNLDTLVAAEKTALDLEKAAAAVEMAESLRIQGTVDFARNYVDQLPEGEARADLDVRLDAVEAAIPVGIAAALAEPGDKECGEPFDLVLTIENKFGEAIPYPEAPGLTVITSDLDGEVFSEEIAYDGDDGEAVASLMLQTRGTHLVTVKATGVSGTVNITIPQTFSDYALTIDGPDELVTGQTGLLSLRVQAEAPFGNSSLIATCEYEVTGGGYSLFQGVGLFGFFNWFELTPDYDQAVALMFIPQEAATYEIKATLRSTDNQVLATAAYTVKTGVAISEVADIDDIAVDYGTPLEEIGLPGQVEVTLADGSVCDIAVTWDQGTPLYDGFEPGTYTFRGTLVPDPGMVNPGDLTASVIAVMQDPFLLALEAVNGADNKTEMKAALEDHAFFLGIDVGEGSAYAALYDHLGGWATDSYQKNAANFVIDKREAVHEGAYGLVEEVALAFDQGVAYELGKLDFHAAVVAGDLDEAAVAAVRGVYHTMGTILGVLEDEELAPLLAMLDVYLEELSAADQQRVDAYVLGNVIGNERKSRDKVFNAMNNEIGVVLTERAKAAFLSALKDEVEAIDVADVVLDKATEEITVTFDEDVGTDAVKDAAEGLIEALRLIVDGTSTL
ncbi:MAG: Ig-like domain-containing protein, partial [Christensenellaceae bacterium]